jgi:isopenicillin-N epimerase
VPPPASIPGARLLFSIDPAVSFLNHGSFGAVPIGVQRVQQRLRDEIESNPVRFYASGLVDRIVHTRRHLATFLGADPEGSALLPNTTTGVSLVLQSVRLESADEVLVTDHVYGAVEMAVRRQCRRSGAIVRSVALPMGASDAEVVARVRSALRPGKTKLLLIDQISSATATVFPVRQVAAAAHEHDIPVLVDAAHVPGMLSVEVAALGVDFWVGNLHKWGFAPRGTALLAVAPAWHRRIDPLVVSWEQEQGFPLSVEYQGTVDYTPWLAAPTGLFTLRTLGWETVRAHNAALAAHGQQVVGAALGVDPVDLPEPGHPEVAMRLVPMPAGLATSPPEAQALRQYLADKLSVETQVSSWNGRGLLRLSAQVYNRADEYERFAERLPAALSSYRR